MSERWLGVTVSGEKLIIVDAEVPATGPLTIVSDQTIALPNGDRSKAYGTIYQRLVDYATDNSIKKVVIKESALSLGGTKKGHLLSAELRGVAMCAFGSVCNTKTMAKARVSKTFGDRKTDEYLADDSFWQAETNGKPLRIGSREAVIYMLAAR
ncbi:hypothetical protein NKI86_20205 [Mesorhizobium sp. M0320]|uniref:hypothetical protein n=1 Tax=Mesorhizobium sp. M0320 TaxID=2956936 RepID=UPI0033352640